MNHLWRWNLERPYYTRAGHKLYPGILNYSLVGLNLCRSRHLRTRDGVGMPHARSGGDALSPCCSPTKSFIKLLIPCDILAQHSLHNVHQRRL